MIAQLAPRPGELALETIRFNAFFATALLSHLQHERIGTMIVTVGATNNCIRAPVPAEAVLGRIPVGREISLFDTSRTYANVGPVAEVKAYRDDSSTDPDRKGGAP
jgi:hypothetical protein